MLISEVNLMHFSWYGETDLHHLAPQIGWQSAMSFEGQFKLFEVMSRDERRIKLNGKHVKVTIQRVL